MGNDAYETKIDVYSSKLKVLSTSELARSAEKLVTSERQHVALLIAHLAEFSERKAHLELGYKNLFEYCVGHLLLSEGSVWMRLQVANVSRRFPQVLQALAEGKISLSVAGLLASRLTEDNIEELLSRSEGKTKREVEELLGSLAPKPAVKPSIRKRACAQGSTEESGTQKETSPEHGFELVSAPNAEVPKRSGKLESAVEDTFNFRFSANQGFREKLTRLGEVLGVHDPERNMAEVIERAMEFTLKRKDPQRKLERRKQREARLDEVAAAAKTASAVGASDPESRETIHRERSRYIPSAARERTLERASYRCEYRAPDGTRCRERTSLEIDHVQPFGKGGGSEESNLRVLCRGHNRLLAERTYGADVIERRIKESTEAREARRRLERVSQAGC